MIRTLPKDAGTAAQVRCSRSDTWLVQQAMYTHALTLSKHLRTIEPGASPGK
jgi:hypothetical protein